MEFANSVVTLIGNIFSCGLILAFLIGVIYGIRFMLQIKQQDKEEYERKKAKDEPKDVGRQTLNRREAAGMICRFSFLGKDNDDERNVNRLRDLQRREHHQVRCLQVR